jgi:fatty acid desaturase
MCNLNYHLEHHLFPAVPWYNLPHVHRLLQEDYRAAGSFIYRSYLRFCWDAVRGGVHREAPRRRAG